MSSANHNRIQGGTISTAPGNGGDGFTTAGQISWTGLVNLSLNTTIDVLSRLSAAGVDIYTLVVGQKVGAQFQLTTKGRQRISDALSKLQSFRSLNETLWFGFGVNHLVRVMAKTEEGKLCLALCASLSECYETSIAAEILIHIVKSSRAPLDLQPSILEWKGLLDSTAGILAATSFPEQAEKFMSLHPYNRGRGFNSDVTSFAHAYDPRRGLSSPESIATALLAVGQITYGRLEAATIVGGADTGWIAAFAEWHFQISVQIVLATTESIIYESHPGEEFPQLRVIYEVDRGRDLSTIQTVGKVYRMLDATALIQRDHSHSPDADTVSGRLQWENAFGATFGSEFDTLTENPQALGWTLGSVARIMKAIACVEPGIDHAFCRLHKYYEPDSYGRNFIANLCQHFPELVPYRKIMEEAAREDVPKAFANYNAHTSALKITCICRKCKDETDKDNEGYCLIVLIDVIIAVGQTLSLVDLAMPFKLSRLGLQALYRRQAVIRSNPRAFPLTYKLFQNHGSIAMALERELGINDVLYNALKLFGGRWIKDLDEEAGVNYLSGPCAVSKSGICAYWQTMGKSDAVRLSGRVCIVQGQIELNGKTFYSLLDDSQVRGIKEPVNALQMTLGLSTADISAVIRETTNTLFIALDIKSSTCWNRPNREGGDGREA